MIVVVNKCYKTLLKPHKTWYRIVDYSEFTPNKSTSNLKNVTIIASDKHNIKDPTQSLKGRV